MIKFRVWDIEQKRMYYEDDLSINFYQDEIYVEVIAHPSEDDYAIQSFELMRYTGLEDANGKEIYEGDIVDKAYHNYRIYPNQWGSVGMGETYGSGYNHNKWLGWLTSAGYSLLDIHANCKVLGNIYENPKLMQDERYFNLFDFQTEL